MGFRAIGVWLGCVAAGGCAHGPPTPGARGVAARGRESVVVLASRLAWPYTLERLAVAVDGAPVYSRSEHAMEAPRLVARLALEPGPHTVAVLAIAAFPCELGSPSDRVLRLRAVQSFVVRRGHPAIVRLHLTTGSPLTGFENRVALTATVEGALPDRARTEAGMAGAARVVPDTACLDPDALVRAECRVAELVRLDRENRDIVALLCHSDKLTALRALRDIASRTTGDATHDLGVQAAVRDRATVLATEAEQCIGEDAFSTEIVYAIVDDRSYEDCGTLEPPPDPAATADALLLGGTHPPL